MSERDTLADLERRRLQLEENVAKLRKSLRHWQQWEVEYEGMKEELLNLGNDQNQGDLQLCARTSLESSLGLHRGLLDIKERKLLIYDQKKNPRSLKDVISLLSRRIDYVQDNIKTSNSLLHAAEEELAATSIFIHPEARDEQGLPLKDIHEELDDEGNVIASSILQPNEKSSEVVEALQKVTATTAPYPEPTSALENAEAHGVAPIHSSNDTSEPINRLPSSESQRPFPTTRDHETSASDLSESSPREEKQRPSRPKKRVSFAEDSKPEPDPSEHPKYLPRSEKERLLRDVCAQVRPELENRWGKKRLKGNPMAANETLGNDISTTLSYASIDADVVEPILKYHQNCQARRLLKALDLNLWEAAKVISVMTKVGNYDLESKQVVDMISTLNGTIEAGQEQGRNGMDLSNTTEAEKGTAKLSKASKNIKYNNSSTNENFVDSVGKSTLSSNSSDQRDKTLHQDDHQEAQQDIYAYSMNQTASNVLQNNIKVSQGKDTLSEKPTPQDNPSGHKGALYSSVVVKGETLEEASLRRQMLKYNMNEVGSVVAELELDSDDNLSDGSHADEESFINLEDSDDDEEDDFGRTTSRVLTEDYLAEMQALEKKLDARTIINAGPQPRVLSPKNGKILKTTTNNTSNIQRAAPKTKNQVGKGVRFADNLDIQEAPSEPNGDALNPPKRGFKPSDKPVVERKTVVDADSPNGIPEKKPSRFKAARASHRSQSSSYTQNASNDPTTPSPTKSLPMSASKVIERPYNPNVKSTVPDDLDPVLLNQQVSDQYHRLRNRMIENEGGFLKPDERTEIPIDEDGGTGGRKMSRFRAARLGMR